MKLGFLTAPFPDMSLTEVADWASANGFESLEIACWPRTTGPTRRYAGTSHIDVATLSVAQGKEVVAQVAINPNTVLKAYRDLEREGLVRARPGQGTFIVRSLPRTDPAGP